ncbi:uncharacterized protein L3040_006632 [Drepanopeziza brunnea f. sp. 'multigermtubi']|uniref:Histone chaperone domain-containing protein n=1 Tax=Marssonina brunnea f. sp. multigermtubi (strain MB_m1) TaxID=1072389 RepID=K1WWR0_MARBU|nr:uncharacterized protein MBM_04377 [Drepanopeziza brunnea f. sp. 'multigermtubi' MB_m1]EKD17516.1 hypothetical protein MBM_04377 [Drepanopeziza brunnea f. sp. 'multigermtubi' MB_m1]KAJ5038959.1 hypothetical protein L3040_006632 [Drepanopeziza brunnea f. sp. 'multigermtubi']
MSAQAESANTPADKGKAAEAEVQDNSMDVDSSSDEEADEVVDDQDAPEDLEEENMEEINPGNIISSGRRTRGVKIDFAKAAAEMGPDDEEEEADDDFVEPPEESDAEMKDHK